MMVSEVTALRKAGELDEALRIALEEFKENDSSINKYSLGWVYYDFCKRAVAENDLDVFLQYVQALKDLHFSTEEIAVVGTAGVLLSSESKFNVDFGAKTIKGYIDTAYEIPLSGKIVGASFSGDQDGVTMKGNFFGPKAAELGGVFSAEHRNSSYQGAFGAKKQ